MASRPGPSSIFLWEPNPKNRASPPLIPSSAVFLAGGAAGAASRTIVAPIERLKILLQVQGSNGYFAQRGIIDSLAQMYKSEGIRGWMRGNGLNCLRIVPHSSVQFATYQTLTQMLEQVSENGHIGTGGRLVAGGLAGMAAVTLTYPLDMLRSRLSCVGAQLNGGIVIKSPTLIGMTVHVVKYEGGVSALYRGLTPTALGVAPYVAINFSVYESLKQHWSAFFDPSIPAGGQNLGTFAKLLCGGAAGCFSQTVTYPLDLLRRRMQLANMEGFHHHASSWDAISSIIKTEGYRGLYRGIYPNLVKVGPSIGTSFAVFELVKDFLEPKKDE